MKKALSRVYTNRVFYLRKKTWKIKRIAFIKQRDYCASLLKEIKKEFYTNLNEKNDNEIGSSGGQ